MCTGKVSENSGAKKPLSEGLGAVVCSAHNTSRYRFSSNVGTGLPNVVCMYGFANAKHGTCKSKLIYRILTCC